LSSFSLEDRDILQLDAAVTTGLLIFLTIGFFGTPTSNNFEFIPYDVSIRLLLTITVLTPFVSSAIIVLISDLLIEHFREQNKVNYLRKVAIVLTVAGFVAIPILLGGLLYVFTYVVQGAS
jgi:hypothetical protein